MLLPPPQGFLPRPRLPSCFLVPPSPSAPDSAADTCTLRFLSPPPDTPTPGTCPPRIPAGHSRNGLEQRHTTTRIESPRHRFAQPSRLLRPASSLPATSVDTAGAHRLLPLPSTSVLHSAGIRDQTPRAGRRSEFRSLRCLLA